MTLDNRGRQANDPFQCTIVRLDPEFRPVVESLRGLWHGLSESRLKNAHRDIPENVLQRQLDHLTDHNVLMTKPMFGNTHYFLSHEGERLLTPAQHLPKPAKPGREP